jgi:integrase
MHPTAAARARPHTLSLDEVVANPCSGLRQPAVRGRRDRIASPPEAAQPSPSYRSVIARCWYRHVRRPVPWRTPRPRVARHRPAGWEDPRGTFLGLRLAAGRRPEVEGSTRTVPIASKLKTILAEHRLATGRAEGLVLGGGGRPMRPQALSDRCTTAWEDAKLDRITLHEARHSYASLMIATGVNAKVLSTYMGHANISITLDRYGHLMPGNEGEAAVLLDGYLSASEASFDAASG